MKKTKRYIKGKHLPCFCDNCYKAFYWQPCVGCKDGHPSFWKTVTESPQWMKWHKEQIRRCGIGKIVKGRFNQQVYDMPEVEELGTISPGHFQEFLKFITPLTKKK